MSRSDETFSITYDLAVEGFDPPQFSVEGEHGKGYFPRVKVPVSLAAPGSAGFTNPILSLVDTGSQFCLFPAALAVDAGIKRTWAQRVTSASGGDITAAFGPGRLKVGATLPAIDVPAIGFHTLESGLCIIGIQFLLQNFQVNFDFPNNRVQLAYEGDSK